MRVGRTAGRSWQRFSAYARREWPAASTSALPGSRRASRPRRRSTALLARGLSACEIDFEGRFWMDYDFAERFGELARRARHRALGARADRRLHGPRRARARS